MSHCVDRWVTVPPEEYLKISKLICGRRLNSTVNHFVRVFFDRQMKKIVGDDDNNGIMLSFIDESRGERESYGFPSPVIIINVINKPLI